MEKESTKQDLNVTGIITIFFFFLVFTFAELPETCTKLYWQLEAILPQNCREHVIQMFPGLLM